MTRAAAAVVDASLQSPTTLGVLPVSTGSKQHVTVCVALNFSLTDSQPGGIIYSRNRVDLRQRVVTE